MYTIFPIWRIKTICFSFGVYWSISVCSMEAKPDHSCVWNPVLCAAIMRTLSAYLNNFEFIDLQANQSDSGFTQQASGVRTANLKKKSIALKAPGLWSWSPNQSIPNGKGKDRAYQPLSPAVLYLLSLLLQKPPLKTTVSGNQGKHESSCSSALTSGSSVQCSWGLITPSLLAPQLGAVQAASTLHCLRGPTPGSTCCVLGGSEPYSPTQHSGRTSVLLHIHLSLKLGL